MTAARRRRRVAAVAVVTAISASLALSACTSPAPTPDQPAAPEPVALSAVVPEHLSLGLVVTLASAPGEGVEWRDAAAGAIVAARRFAMGGTSVDLVTVNDKGTAAGASAAVASLNAQGVAGIVLATSGSHLTGALTEAAADGVPVLLPYASSAAGLPAHAWVTGPTTAQTDAALVRLAKDRGLTKPLLVDAGGAGVSGLTPSATLRYAAGGDASALAKTAAARQQKDALRADSVVVSGPPQLQADVVQALQGAAVNLPFVLTPQALSPAFPAALVQAQGSLAGDFLSAGPDDGDSAALTSTSSGRALAAYFAALRLTASDPSVKDPSGGRAFSAVAGAADVRSHDAVVTLVRAAAAAGAVDHNRVAQALAALKPTAEDGLAGPALDLSTPTALASDAVVPLESTPDSPGLRPLSDATPSLYWFAITTS